MSLKGVPCATREMLARPRLIEQFDAEVEIVVAHAPIGYGKTVAMAQWAGVTDRAGVWMRVPDGAAEPRAFVARLAEALVDHCMVPGDDPLAMAADSLRGRADPWALLARGLRRIDGGVTLALDDADVLTDATAVGLIELTNDVPSLSLRVLTRRSSPFTEPALALTGRAAVIGAEELALTREEATGILEDREDLVSSLLLAGGAPALARAMALGATATDGSGQRAVQAAVESLFRMRGRAWDVEFRDFVATACLPEWVSVGFASELSGRADAAGLLDRAEHEGLGTWTALRESPTARFVFAPFVRYAAVQSLRERVPSDRVQSMLRAVARWDLSEGSPFSALRAVLAAEDLALANDIVRQSWVELTSYGAQVRELFRVVPTITLRSWPLIAMLLGILANARGNHRLRALEYFALASYGARSQRAKAAPADRALLLTLESVARRLSGNQRRALESARSAYEALRELSLAEQERLGRNQPTLYAHLGISFFGAGESTLAVESARRALALYDEAGGPGGVVALSLMAGFLASSGDMREADAVVEEATRRPWPEGWIDGYEGTQFQVARAYHALEAGDPESAEQALRLLDRTLPANEHWPVLTHVNVMIALMRGRADEALVALESQLRTQRGRYPARGLPRSTLAHTRALVDIARGDLAAAERALERERDTTRTIVGRARIALAAGDADKAERLLQTRPAEVEDSRLLAEHLALRTAAAALTAADSHTRALLGPLDALLEARGLLLPLAAVPVAGLEAIEAMDPDPRLAERVRRARAIALLGSGVAARPRLSPRELAVARELARTETVAQIAEALVVSPNTVKSQLRSIYRKLGVSKRSEAVHALAALGITEEG